MHSESVKHTLAIFEQLYHTLPPLVPPQIKTDMGQALEQLRLNYNLTLSELEDTMIVFGRQIWPYRQAFHEFLDIYEGKLGEKFLSAKLSRGLKKRYQEFQAHNGNFRDLLSGGTLNFFTSAEKLELCEVLIATKDAVRQHAIQAVFGTEQAGYEDKIMEFDEILKDIEKRLDTLRQTADDEQEHPELAAEIRERIRGFEYGLCSLGPQVDHAAVCEAAGFFAERRLEKKRYRMI